MPAIIDRTAAQYADVMYGIQNQNQFSKLSVYFVLNQLETLPTMEVFGALYGDIPWQPNMGPTMQGVRIEKTPRTRTVFRPNSIQTKAMIDIYDQKESQERASVDWHKFVSPNIYFLRNWQDFLSNQIMPAMENINDNVVYSNEMYIQTKLWDRAPYVYFASRGLVAAPHNGPPGYIATPKGDGVSAASPYLIDQFAQMQGECYLTFPRLEHMLITAIEELKCAPFNGVKNLAGKDNDLVNGRWVVLTSVEAWSQLKWDESFQKLRATTQDYAFSKFRGSPFDELIMRGLETPWRATNEGLFVAPEIEDETTGEPIPNPVYADVQQAPWEMGWFLGGQLCRTVKIGPPPKEFGGNDGTFSATPKQVNGMNWNGKIYLTNKIITQELNSQGQQVYDPNSWNEYCRAQGILTMGLLPKRARNGFPFWFRRSRTSTGARA